MDFLPGECSSYIENDIFHIIPCTNKKSFVVAQPGILTVTNYRIIFTLSEPHECENPMNVYINIPLGLISRVSKIGGVTSKKLHGYRIEVVLKNLRNIQFALNPKNHGRRQMFERLITYAFPLNHKRPLFAFVNQEKFEDIFDGWKIFDPIAEYKRILVRQIFVTVSFFHYFEFLSVSESKRS